MLQSWEKAGGKMIVAVGGSVQVQVSSITWVQHVSLTSWTYIYNPSLMIFSPNLASFHSKPLWSVICILAPTGWKLFGWDFFFSLPHCLLFCIFSLTHSPYLGLVNSSLPLLCLSLPPWLPLSPAPSIPLSPPPRCSGSPFNISCAPERNKQISWRGGAGFNLGSSPVRDPWGEQANHEQGCQTAQAWLEKNGMRHTLAVMEKT